MAKKTAAQRHAEDHKQRRIDRERNAITMQGNLRHVAGATDGVSGMIAGVALPRAHLPGLIGYGTFLFADKNGELYIVNAEHGTISRPKLI